MLPLRIRVRVCVHDRVCARPCVLLFPLSCASWLPLLASRVVSRWGMEWNVRVWKLNIER